MQEDSDVNQNYAFPVGRTSLGKNWMAPICNQSFHFPDNDVQ